MRGGCFSEGCSTAYIEHRDTEVTEQIENGVSANTESAKGEEHGMACIVSGMGTGRQYEIRH